MSIKTVIERLEELDYKPKEKGESIVLNVSSLNFKEIYKFKEKIKKEIVSGIKGISQVLIVKREKDYVVTTLGTNLKKVLLLKEIDKNNIISNDFHEVAGIFGIEAGRQLIIDEINRVLNTQGLDIDIRHLELAADAMTNTGEVKGITRMGIIAQKSSILARATFETPVKQFVNASVKGSKDKLTSVVENIILNQPVPVGTGLPGLLVKVVGPMSRKSSEIKRAKERFPSLDVRLGNVEQLDFSDTSIDAVYMINVIHYVDGEKSLGEAVRVLMQGGFFFVHFNLSIVDDEGSIDYTPNSKGVLELLSTTNIVHKRVFERVDIIPVKHTHKILELIVQKE